MALAPEVGRLAAEGKNGPRPPMVKFEIRPVEDREASLKAGHYVPKDEHFAIITPPGNKDRVERAVKDWFNSLENEVRSERIPREFLDSCKEKYKRWAAGEALEVDGTPIKTWTVLSPSQVKRITDADVFSVEDLAVANEGTLARIGMGARDLQNRAKDWMKAADGTGKVAQELTQLRTQRDADKQSIEHLTEQVNQLMAQTRAMQAMLPQVQAPGGNPPSPPSQPGQAAFIPPPSNAGGVQLDAEDIFGKS